MTLGSFRRYLQQQLWFRPALASLFSLLMAAGALWFGRTYDGKFNLDIDEASLVALFSIFASSMLSVATFTVSAIVAAASSASNSTTARASRFILTDGTAQVVLSAFIAAFIYSISGILALKAFHYGHAGRFVLFAGLILVVIFVLVSFIRWVDHVMKLGRQSTTMAKLADAATGALDRNSVHAFGAKVWDGTVPSGAAPVHCVGFGYVVEVDVARLQELAEARDCHIMMTVRPGEFSDPTRAIAHVAPGRLLTPELSGSIAETVHLSPSRDATDDIRFTVVNLAETADRALSPAVNDPGTAIYVLNILLQILSRWAELQAEDAPPITADRVAMPAVTARELVNDAFTPIARDGAGTVEVGVRLQKVLAALARLKHAELAEQAQAMSQTAVELADHALVAQAHKDAVRRAAADVAPAP